ncbi:MAG: GNAT family N-acetyltransferase [Acidobacteriota bacterium]|nr:GNAT family N-acetyltransferase [Acidobacteriota bacterium]
MPAPPPGLVIRRAHRARPAQPTDWDAIWPIFHAVVAAGDTYAYDPETPEPAARDLWMPESGGAATYLREAGGTAVGTYLLRPNQPGLGSHVANAGYMVRPDASGQGIGRALCEHSMAEARAAGFRAMQFNFVVSTNERAIALWQKLGFTIAGTLPQAFRHRRLGFVDAYVMHRLL